MEIISLAVHFEPAIRIIKRNSLGWLVSRMYTVTATAKDQTFDEDANHGVPIIPNQQRSELDITMSTKREKLGRHE